LRSKTADTFNDIVATNPRTAGSSQGSWRKWNSPPTRSACLNRPPAALRDRTSLPTKTIATVWDRSSKRHSPPSDRTAQ
jgi:hypothetical protein